MSIGEAIVERRGRRGRFGRSLSVGLLLLALGGCGSSGSGSHASVQTTTTTTTPPQPAPTRVHSATVLVTTRARTNKGTLDQRYTCRGAGIAPTITWKLPEGEAAHAKELMVFVRTITAKAIITNWAVAGLRPTLTSIGAGRLPAGTVVARNSFGQVGYHLCPPAGSVVTMGVYAVPKKVGLKAGFQPEAVKPLLESETVEWGGAEMFQHKFS